MLKGQRFCCDTAFSFFQAASKQPLKPHPKNLPLDLFRDIFVYTFSWKDNKYYDIHKCYNYYCKNKQAVYGWVIFHLICSPIQTILIKSCEFISHV